MTLKKTISARRPDILRKWLETIFASYPPETATFLRTQNQQFRNPVGSTIQQAAGAIFDAVIQGEGAERIQPHLDSIIRIRAVQDFTPSEALAFIFRLKQVVREDLQSGPPVEFPPEEMVSFEQEVDSLAMTAFDIFMQCREKIYEIKANEARNMTFRLLQRVNMVPETADADPEVEGSNLQNIQRNEVPK